MNNSRTLTKKDLHRQDDEIPRLIVANSPANILKSARESLKHLETNKPVGQYKRPRPHIKLPHASPFSEESVTAKLRPFTKDDTRELFEHLQPNRARSAYDVRDSISDDTFFLKITPPKNEIKKKSSSPKEKDKSSPKQEGNHNDSLLGDIMSQKTIKTFIIKHKRSASRKGSNDYPDITPSPTSTIPTHFSSRFSSCKEEPIRAHPLDPQDKSIIEEMKSESYLSSRTMNTIEDSAHSKQEANMTNSKQEGQEKALEELSTELATSIFLTRSKSIRQNTIIKRDSQVNFNVKIGEVLGEGAYGVVYKALNMETGQFVAVKHIKLGELQNKSTVGLSNFCTEIEVYQKLVHQNIVPYIGAKQENDDIYIYMEYMQGGSLSSMLKQYGPFEEKIIRKFTKQVVDGLHYLHEKGVIHRDIKGGNILSDGSGNVKLGDFGASKHIENISLLSSVTGSEVCNSIKGSLFWMAPELINQEKHGRKIDIWSLGCTVIEMATAKHPWPDTKGFPELVFAIMTKKCPPIPEHLSEAGKDFIRQCCQFDKKLRPRTGELLNHPFLKEENDELKQNEA